MELIVKIEFLRRAVASNRRTLQVQTTLAAGLVTLGVAVVLLSIANPTLVLPESLRGGQTLGGAGVAALGSIAIRSSRRDKVEALSLLLAQYELQRARMIPDEMKKLDQYFDQFYGKGLGA